MEIEENKLKRILSDLKRYRSEYYSARGRARERVADSVRCYGNNLPDELIRIVHLAFLDQDSLSQT